MRTFIQQMEPWIDENEVRHMTSYLSSGAWLTEYKKTAEFEEMLAAYTGAKHCVVVANGTVSMSVAYWARGIGKGDEVLVPNFTMIATANAVRLVGAEPVLVDIERDTLCMDIEAAKRSVTGQTKAVALVSMNGRAPDMEAWRDFCSQHDLFFLEDAAQSLGSFQGQRHLGTFGNVGSLSFSALKIITTGQGGALLTDEDELARSMRKIKDFGRERGGIDWHDVMGQNFKFTDIQAVIGIEQMKKLSWRVARKKAIYGLYQARLSNLPEVEMIPTSEETAPWFVDVYVHDRDKLAEYLRVRHVGNRPVYPPINKQQIYPNSGVFPISENYCGRGLWLPSSSKLADEEVDYVCDQIEAFFAEVRP
jgi:perosamine synthetase